MAAIVPPEPTKLICGMISSYPELMDQAAARLAERLGAIDITSQTWPFDFTDYYRPQMGENLLRRFVAFETLLRDPADLMGIKQFTNDLEDAFAAANAGGPTRPINLDPGYIAQSKLVLASMKDFSHRIYLGGGVYGEITLQYHHGWTSLPWTFPDYGSDRYHDFLTKARNRLREQLKGEV